MTIDWRAMKKDWGKHAEREMESRAKWWEERNNKRLAKEYREAIAEMNKVIQGDSTQIS